MQAYADVIVDIAHANVDRVFQYRIPDEMKLECGQRVLVPFGRGDHGKEGYVVALSDTPQISAERIKSIYRKLEDYQALRPDQVRLAVWMTKKYHCMLVEALRLMIPAQIRGSRMQEKTLGVATLCAQGEPLQRAKAALLKRAPVQARIVEMLEQAERMAVSDICAFLPNARPAVQALIKKGLVKVEAVVVNRKPYQAIQGKQEAHAPTEAQQRAIDAIAQGLKDRKGKFLLHGATGSGKTEVYLQAIELCLSRGRGAIVLVPEISLTPQMVARFRARFGDTVAVMHSKLSAGERYDEWRRVLVGGARVVIGPRSALFAPMENIGLIVIDEEHEQSYRNEQRPQFEAATVAAYRCQDSGGVLVLGSATPSLITYHACTTGDMTLLEMPDRVGEQGLAKVTIADMRKELALGNRTIFSATLYAAMKRCLDRGEQMMLFINRRGYATFLMCRGCGHVMGCAQCDVSMTYHKTRWGGRLSCHYCGAQQEEPAVCPECGKPYLKQFGVGTQQVEEQVLRHFPQARVLRMDLDTTREKDAHLKILQAFENGEADVLVGTQMIAKGLDFGRVTLVGVIAADASLFLPDFRSAERTFQLIMQVAGRAGRDKLKGSVVVQTYHPEHFAIDAAVAQDYRAFYTRELQNRQFAEFPPFAVFVRLLFRGEEQVAHDAVERAHAMVRRYLEQRDCKPLMLDFGNAPVAKIKGEARTQVLIKLRVDSHTDTLVDGIFAMFPSTLFAGCAMMLEVNPPNML